ncbi:MAG: cation diffusion facilitator family transporter [Patescibacteria group bacterium]
MRSGHFRTCRIEIGNCLCDFKRYWIIFSVTLAILVFQIAGGIASGSLALLSDAGHVFGDFIAIIVAIVIAYLVYLHSHWEGFMRKLGVYAHSALLFVIAVVVFLEAVHRMHGTPHVAPFIMLSVAVVGACGNMIQHRILMQSSAHATREGMRQHIRFDFLQSIVVIVTAPVIWITGITLFDPVVSIAIAFWMVWGAIHLLKYSSSDSHGHTHHVH